MARDKLNAAKIKARKKPGLLGDGGNLWIRIAPGGTKSWVLRYMLKGDAREMGLGSWPDRTLDEARKRALEARQLLLDHIDPIENRRAKYTASLIDSKRMITFEECARYYIADKREGWKNAKHAAQWETTLKVYVHPILGKLPVASIDKDLVLQVLKKPFPFDAKGKPKYPDGIWKGIPETGSRVRNRIELVLDWATASDFRTGDNPARWKGHLDKLLTKPSALKAPGRAKASKHFAALPFEEIPEFMAELREVSGVSAQALQFAIYTACRSGEVRGATWEEINFEQRMWIIPAKRMKSAKKERQEHRVPLSEASIQVLQSMGPRPKGLIFSSRGGQIQLSDMSLTACLRRLGCEVTVGDEKRKVTTHGFRSSFKDFCSERTSFPNEVSEMALAHVIKNEAEASYRRGDLFEKRRKLMQVWASYCSQPPMTGKVIGINAANTTNAKASLVL